MASQHPAVVQAHEEAKKAFASGVSKPYEFRMTQLRNLKRFFAEHETTLAQALGADLHRCDFEAIGLEIATAVKEIDLIMANLKSWMKPVSTAVPALFLPATSHIVHEPLGVCLVIGAFNYPVVLTLGPMIGAIAAGNCVVVKPSEMAVATERVLSEILPKYIDSSCFKVVCGDYKVSAALLELRWDKIFFTGSTRVGKIVLKAAAEHLTPVSLELGGKSPTIIDKSVRSLELAAQRVLWGKGVNAGQTCIAPDYVYVHESIHDDFVAMLKKKIDEFYGSDVRKSPDYSRIITAQHFQRLHTLLEQNRSYLYCGGETLAEEKFISPSVFTGLPMNSTLMQEELFGPLLPVFKYKNIDEVIQYVNAGEKPLTMYIFSADNRLVQKLVSDISSGSILVNDVLFNFANLHAPFGGVGHSGMGGYHGKFSFDCFSHKKPVLYRDDHKWLDIPIRYPPYSKFALDVFRIGAKLPDLPAMCLCKQKMTILVVLLAGVVAYAFCR